MSEKTQKKSDILRDRVAALVVEFVNQEGGISQSDLVAVLGRSYDLSVTYALYKIPTKFSHCREASPTEAAPVKTQSKRGILRDRVVALVMQFVNQEGMSKSNLNALFDEGSSVAAALYKTPFIFSPVS